MALTLPQAGSHHYDDYHFYLRPAQIASISTFSTTATAPNLPGPGRVIGLGYDALGHVLVSRINRLNARFRRQGAATNAQMMVPDDAQPSSALPSGVGLNDGPPGASASRESFSTMATAPNLPGTGRVLGLVYDKLAARLVTFLTKWALKLGLGPDEVNVSIFEKMYHIEHDGRRKTGSGLSPVRLGDLSRSDIVKLRKACKRLIKYAS